jgi:pyroglutamyl-peptidase
MTVKFIVTGFGPFQGVKENPTTWLANLLVQYLEQMDRAAASSSSSLASRTRTIVLETSSEAACTQIDALYEELTGSRTNWNNCSVVIVLHLGVNDGGTTFQLESCAYNEATFRIPDERGYQPIGQPVCGGVGDSDDANDDDGVSCRVGQTLYSPFDVPNLVQQLNATSAAEASAVRASVSTDPGRFVCNYTYCYSLHSFRDCANVRCLFLHVPPLWVAPLQDQLRFVAGLMEALERTAMEDGAIQEHYRNGFK